MSEPKQPPVWVFPRVILPHADIDAFGFSIVPAGAETVNCGVKAEVL
jgi:hypothetical protein